MRESADRIARPGCVLVCLLFLSGCGSDSSPDSVSVVAPDSGTAADTVSALRLASTTSTRDSGLFDVLLPEFEKENRCRVDLVAVGTGAALKLGESGDVDVVFVHARAAEEAFMAAGHGTRHEPVMHNFFLIVGPPDDPADIIGTEPAAALKKIATGKSRFLSRGDDSGTHKRELQIWESAGGRPDWEQYAESGQGMGPTLTMADEMQACVLVDGGTWLKMKSRLNLIPLVQEGEELKNPYAAMVVSSTESAPTKSELANRFVDFLISEKAQRLIANYRIEGQPLFHPDRLSKGTAE